MTLETLHLSTSSPPGVCASCDDPIPLDMKRLRLTVAAAGFHKKVARTVDICQVCLDSYAPNLAAELAAAENEGRADAG